MKNVIFFFTSCLFFIPLHSTTYSVTNDAIDVVIPCTDKDLDTLDLCIDGIRNNCQQIRRIITISDRRLTEKAEWIDEKQFPFSKENIAYI